MSSHTLLARFGHALGSHREPGSSRFLHRFSDSVLHTALLIGLALLLGLVLYEAITLTVNVWRFDPVVVEGQATLAKPGPVDLTKD